MAIRIRIVNEHYVALCAAESEQMDGDLYLNDGIHTALTEKFTSDFREMGFLKDKYK